MSRFYRRPRRAMCCIAMVLLAEVAACRPPAAPTDRHNSLDTMEEAGWPDVDGIARRNSWPSPGR
jgi:hypothetical protein